MDTLSLFELSHDFLTLNTLLRVFRTLFLFWNSLTLFSHIFVLSESVPDTLSPLQLTHAFLTLCVLSESVPDTLSLFWSTLTVFSHSNTPTTTVHALKLKLLIEALYCNKHFLPLALKQGLFHYLSLGL